MKCLLPPMYTLLNSKSICFLFPEAMDSQFKNNTEIKAGNIPIKENTKKLRRYLMDLKREWARFFSTS